MLHDDQAGLRNDIEELIIIQLGNNKLTVNDDMFSILNQLRFPVGTRVTYDEVRDTNRLEILKKVKELDISGITLPTISQADLFYNFKVFYQSEPVTLRTTYEQWSNTWTTLNIDDPNYLSIEEHDKQTKFDSTNNSIILTDTNNVQQSIFKYK